MSLQELLRDQSIEQVRQVRRNLEKEHNSRRHELREAIGSHHEDIVTLAKDIVSLRQHVGSLRLDLNSARKTTPETELDNAKSDSQPTTTQWSGPMLEIIEQRLLVLADQFYVHNRFGSAALAIYFCENLTENQSGPINLRRTRLNYAINAWQNSAVADPSQDLFQAAIILWRLRPSQLVKKIEEIRRDQIVQKLSQDFPSAVSLLDATVVVLSHLSTDLLRTRLSRRRLVDTIEFSNLGLGFFEPYLPPSVRELKVYPEACYENDDNLVPAANSEVFIASVSPFYSKAFADICQKSCDPPPLASAMIEVVQCMWDASEPENFSELLNDLLNIFFLRFSTLIEAGAADTLIPQDNPEETWPVDELSVISSLAALRYKPFTSLITACDLWKSSVLSTQRAILQLKNSTRQAARVSPDLAKRLADFADASGKSLKRAIESIYQRRRVELSGVDLSTASLDEAFVVRMTLGHLDQSFEELGGEPISECSALDEIILEKLGLQAATPQELFRVARRIDELLEGNPWPAGVVERLRRFIMTEKSEDDHTEVNNEHSNQGFENTGDSKDEKSNAPDEFEIEYSRSWLLLSPISEIR